MNPKTVAESLSLVIGDLNILRRRLEYIIDAQGGDGSPRYVAVGQLATEVRRMAWDASLLREEFIDREAEARQPTKAPDAPLARYWVPGELITSERVNELERENAILKAEVAVLEGKLEGRLR